MIKRQLVNISDASKWASQYLNRDISPSNISYLVQYGRVEQYDNNLIDLNELKLYYNSYHGNRELKWKDKLGHDLNWGLSFDHLRERDTTKHVHRLHPYKGKFIPQLVEYIIDNNTDDYKSMIYFKKGDILLDPFCGSGTTLVQANELGINSIGIDISHFNCIITETKLAKYDFTKLLEEIDKLNKTIQNFESENKIIEFDKELLHELSLFNKKYFPNPQFRRQLNQNLIGDEKKFGYEKEVAFLEIYQTLVEKYNLKLKQDEEKSFLDRWYINNTRNEIDFVMENISIISDSNIKNILSIILSRTIRSCRATTHSDLATLKDPQFTTYYCFKHKKICKPIYSIKKWFKRYTNDTIRRLVEFDSIRNDSFWEVIQADSRNVNIFDEIKTKNIDFHKILNKQKIKGIFSSPPYVGQIDYHEQHAYSYELLSFERKDELEIGPLYGGQGIGARNVYVVKGS